MSLLEKGPGFKSGWKDLPKYLNGKTIGAGIVSTIFGCTGPCLVVIAAAETAGFTLADTVTWVFGIYLFGGLLGVIFGLALSYGLCQMLGTSFVLNAGAIALGVGFSAAVGIIFGWAPARKASRLNPIDALRAV